MSQHEIDEAERAMLVLFERLSTAISSAEVMAYIHGARCNPEDVGLLDKVKEAAVGLASLASAAEERADESEQMARQNAEQYEKLLDKFEAAEARVRELETAFKHMHVAEQGEPLSDSCAECGLDLRDPIHKRLQDV